MHTINFITNIFTILILCGTIGSPLFLAVLANWNRSKRQAKKIHRMQVLNTKRLVCKI